LIAEALGMSPEEFAIVARPVAELGSHLGLEVREGQPTALEQIAHVPRFLESTGVSFTDLIALTSTRFINGDDALKLETSAPDRGRRSRRGRAREAGGRP
jgi:hypothetical protein